MRFCQSTLGTMRRTFVRHSTHCLTYLVSTQSDLEFSGRMSVGLRPIREGVAGSRRCGLATVWSSTITDMAARELLWHGAVAIK
jgi:hypothetical protein